MIFPIVIASALLAFTALPQGVLSAQPEPCPHNGTRLGAAYSEFEFQGQGQVLVEGCNKFPDSLTVSSYQLISIVKPTCQFLSNSECDNKIGWLWEANDRSDRWVTGGNDQAKSALCFITPQYNLKCSEYVGAIYGSPNLLGPMGPGLALGCNELYREEPESVLILPIEVSCKFYDSVGCSGGVLQSLETNILEKQGWMDHAQSVYCAPI